MAATVPTTAASGANFDIPANGAAAPELGDVTAQWRSAILTVLDDDKAEDVIEIALGEKSSVADVMIVASGRSQRHVSAIADHMLRALKDAGAKNIQVEGMANADWVLIDAGDVVVHLFRPDVRAFYNLEKLWDPENSGPRPAQD